MPNSQDRREPFFLTTEFWIAVVTVIVTLSVPGVFWAGRVEARLGMIEKQNEELRTQIREDLREINRKLDDIMRDRAGLGESSVRR